jgi:hypothetical protein
MQAQKRHTVTDTEDAEIKVSHYIPSVELKGSRGQKLEKLDALIAHLERLRKSLAGDAEAAHSALDGPSQHAYAPSWPWFTAGIVVGVLLTLWLLLARIVG